MPRILAIDYGHKRVGLAVTDPLKILANSLETVETKDALDYIKRYCAKEEVESFVVGKPLRFNGEDNEVELKIEKFIGQLAMLFPDKKIHRVDERLTSKMAQQTLLLSGVNKKARADKGTLDRISATLILQTFMQMTP